MKKPSFLILLFFNFLHQGFAQYWQQEVDYNIAVKLNDSTHGLDAFETINYKNNSNDTLHFLWIHLWPNAYRNDRTAFSEQQLKNGNTNFYFSKEKDRGFIDQLNFEANNQALTVEPHPLHLDIVKLILPIPVAPNNTIKITTPFHIQLPKIFSRSGHLGQSYQIAQWFPKVAVYDKEGWHPMPYLDLGEFYADFGSYDVSITVPSKYVIAATGNLVRQQKDESFTTYQYAEKNIHDFAWFADPNFKKYIDSSQEIKFEYYALKEIKNADNILSFMKRSVEFKNSLLGNYPYKTIKVVEDINKRYGGMEYPTITVLHADTEKDLDLVINHEIGHNWFQGILATNERTQPWMDEGMNSYHDRLYEAKYYSNIDGDEKKSNSSKKLSEGDNSYALKTLQATNFDQPISSNSESFNSINYGMIAYEKASAWMKHLSDKMGAENFSRGMQSYFTQWRFKHPTPLDFKKVMESVASQNLDESFALLDTTGFIKKEPKKTKLNFLFNLDQKENIQYINHAPIVGANFYDGVMLGAVIHNYNLPPGKFQFLLAPMYGTRSSLLNGLAKANYRIYPSNDARHLTIHGNFAKFTGDNFQDSTGKINNQPFTKITSGIKYVFGNLDLSKKVRKWIEFKSFIIDETTLSFTTNPTTNELEITYPKQRLNLQQLIIGMENTRVLYPYEVQLKTELEKQFARISLTTHQYFNYANGGGLNLRIFAGKFIYRNDNVSMNRFATERFHLNMSGPKGDEDYEYDNYFYGRNEFDGFAARQIMERDGAFKVKTDFLSNKIGKTDDWLAAINLTSTIPNSINPLSLLPFKIPLKLFFDIGTNAPLWNAAGSGSKFLYDGGVQLSLLKNVLNIYFPIVYSKLYGDYFKSTIPGNTFKNNISFSINFKELALSKLFPGFNL